MGFRGENPPSDLLELVSGSVTCCRPAGAFGSIRGGSVLVRSGQLGRVQVWVDTPKYWEAKFLRAKVG